MTQDPTNQPIQNEAAEDIESIESVKPKRRTFTELLENNPVGRWCYRRRYGLLIFFLPVLIMYLVYSCFGVHPYGDLSVLVLDLNGQ